MVEFKDDWIRFAAINTRMFLEIIVDDLLIASHIQDSVVVVILTGHGFGPKKPL
jgi:hypothetical protein